MMRTVRRRAVKTTSTRAPDILNPKEGVFCDHSTDTHMPLCGGEGAEVVDRHCYQRHTHSVVYADMTMRMRRGYSYIDHWD